jgi:hypothetical protein
MRLLILVAVAMSYAVLGLACDNGEVSSPEATETAVSTPMPIPVFQVTPTSEPPTPPLSLDLADGGALATFVASGQESIKTGTSSVATGDFNGDGVEDLLVGAAFADGPDGSREDAGEAYLIFGSEGLRGTLDLAPDDVDLVVYGAQSGDNLGFGVAAADLNNDGVDDVVVSAPASDGRPAQRTDVGEVYVIHGSADLGGEVDILKGQQDFTFIAAEGFARAGSSLVGMDVNGDDIDDLVIGAPFAGREPGTPPGGRRTSVGEVYVVFGSPSFGGSVSVASEDQDVTFVGDDGFDGFGRSVAVGDVDGDGIGDIVVGASDADGPDNERADGGEAFVFLGSRDLNGRVGTEHARLRVIGADGGDALGRTVGAGDFNGDGFSDVVLIAPQADGRGNARDASGEAYVLFGASDLAGEIDLADGAADVVIYGADSGDLIGTALSVASIDGDELDDIAVGAPFASSAGNGRLFAGEVYVIPGKALSGNLDLRFDVEDITFVYGADVRDEFGAGLTLGDFNGDGSQEVAVVAPKAAGPDGRIGKVYVIALPEQ